MYNVGFQVYSKVNQLCIYPFFLRFFAHVGHSRILSSFLCAILGPCWLPFSFKQAPPNLSLKILLNILGLQLTSLFVHLLMHFLFPLCNVVFLQEPVPHTFWPCGSGPRAWRQKGQVISLGWRAGTPAPGCGPELGSQRGEQSAHVVRSQQTEENSPRV